MECNVVLNTMEEEKNYASLINWTRLKKTENNKKFGYGSEIYSIPTTKESSNL
jgi:hypothetical protein